MKVSQFLQDDIWNINPVYAIILILGSTFVLVFSALGLCLYCCEEHEDTEEERRKKLTRGTIYSEYPAISSDSNVCSDFCCGGDGAISSDTYVPCYDTGGGGHGCDSGGGDGCDSGGGGCND